MSKNEEIRKGLKDLETVANLIDFEDDGLDEMIAGPFYESFADISKKLIFMYGFQELSKKSKELNLTM